MTTFLIFLNSVILAAAGVLHIYWAAGGQWAKNEIAPTESFSRELEKPRGRMLTRFIGLLCFAGVVVLAGRGGLLNLPISSGVWITGCWLMAGLFTLRALFGFVGTLFVDTGTTPEFDHWNLRLFSPLFLFLGVTTALINFL